MLLELPEIKIEKLDEPLFEKKEIQVFIQREDLTHPIISGNKWRKLRFNVEKTQQLKKKAILTFGGAHSNHLHATAEACKLANIKAIGIVRGEEIDSKTLSDCKNAGMDLIFVDRQEYQLKDTKEYLNWLNEKFDYPYIIPQGGDNYYGTLGCMEILKGQTLNPDLIFVASGTGNTASGILLASNENQKVVSVPALKGEFMKDEIRSSIQNFLQNKEVAEEYLERLVVLNDYHFGGFAKYKPELIEFISNFHKKHQVKLDPIYTSKMMFALYDQIEKNQIPKNTTVLAIHTGGLQGIEGFEKRYSLKLF